MANHTYDVKEIKAQAKGRWQEIMLAVVPSIDPSSLDGKGHPCPKCGGNDRYCAMKDFTETGALFCRQCFNKKNGDGLSAIQWLQGSTFPEALNLVAQHLGIQPRQGLARSGKDRSGPFIPIIERVLVDAREIVERKTQQTSVKATASIYTSAEGKEVMAVVRVDLADGSKSYRPYHVFEKPLPALGKSIPHWRRGDPPGKKLPLYNLPQVVAAQTVCVFEGEKAADAAHSLGFVSTTSAHGAKSAKKTDWSPLAHKEVILFPDNDQPGEQFVEDVVRELEEHAPAKVSVKRLSRVVDGFPEGGDIVDAVKIWTSQGKSNEEIAEIIRSLPDEEATQSKVDPETQQVCLPGGDVTINDTCNKLGPLVAATGYIFLRAGDVVRVYVDDEGQPRSCLVRPAVFCSLIETVADLVKITTTKDGVSEIKPAICSEAIARLILACETFKLSLPLITFLAPSPVLIDDNGKLVQVTGYHGATAFSRFAAICQKLNCRGQSSLSIPYWLIFGSQRMATLLGLWVTVNESPSLQCVVG